MDEMGQQIRLRSEEYGFKFILLELSLWTLWECYVAFSTGQRFYVPPMLVLAGGLAVQAFNVPMPAQNVGTIGDLHTTTTDTKKRRAPAKT